MDLSLTYDVTDGRGYMCNRAHEETFIFYPQKIFKHFFFPAGCHVPLSHDPSTITLVLDVIDFRREQKCVETMTSHGNRMFSSDKTWQVKLASSRGNQKRSHIFALVSILASS